MRLLYSIGIFIASFAIKLLAKFNTKLKLGVNGRKVSLKTLRSKIEPNDKTFWFHCASLGEYEQGLPVFEALRRRYPDYKIVLTFFSPSGFEVRKNAKIADVAVYMPMDSLANAKQFLTIVNPTLIIFVKYEIWPNVLYVIKKRNINALLISAVFRQDQSFFKWYGGLMRSSLSAFNHIYTQDQNSKNLLNTNGFKNVSVSGDTRFDRVFNQLKLDNNIPFIKKFINTKTCVVFGSTWPADDKLFFDFINKNQNKELKFLIAPHNIKKNYITKIKAELTKKTICFSDMADKNVSEYDVFILDTIGYLSKIYSYAHIVYVGGAAGSTGLHNILEPAVFGIPILIGNNYDKFPEAKALISKGGVDSVSTSQELSNKLNALLLDEKLTKQKGKINSDFILENKGAVHKILDTISL
ncbi:glycosyltransferase N-terminal domain-containing protein [uncultured Winogradskyella sp.]|uniref:3-deoxy-D-manno-octulosonic acid transferase n=1 Tax=uncultured Winogradskyella sp. TaxID=395353 RepID=UPI0026161DA4|nr:glycosyltransferase N-terminal domain-containing protein [uncultured Winogradskyella sp.]